MLTVRFLPDEKMYYVAESPLTKWVKIKTSILEYESNFEVFSDSVSERLNKSGFEK